MSMEWFGNKIIAFYEEAADCTEIMRNDPKKWKNLMDLITFTLGRFNVLPRELDDHIADNADKAQFENALLQTIDALDEVKNRIGGDSSNTLFSYIDYAISMFHAIAKDGKGEFWSKSDAYQFIYNRMQIFLYDHILSDCPAAYQLLAAMVSLHSWNLSSGDLELLDKILDA